MLILLAKSSLAASGRCKTTKLFCIVNWTPGPYLFRPQSLNGSIDQMLGIARTKGRTRKCYRVSVRFSAQALRDSDQALAQRTVEAAALQPEHEVHHRVALTQEVAGGRMIGSALPDLLRVAGV